MGAPASRVVSMPVTLESVMDALGQVIDPEIRRPITDLNMVTPRPGHPSDGSSVAVKSCSPPPAAPCAPRSPTT